MALSKLLLFRKLFPSSLNLSQAVSPSSIVQIMFKQIILLAILVCSLQALRDQPYSAIENVKDQQQYWFRQVVDHYDYSTVSYWQQRYWVVDTYYKAPSGPVYLFICGEYVCNGVPAARQWVVQLAQRTQGIVLVLEHRFYGQSLPFGNKSLSIENMRLLNSEQALKDLAYFTMQVTALKIHNVGNGPWISVGGSYPGALSAWYRSKYPHLTIAAIASSAVIVAIADFQMFDEQMYLSSVLSGDYCVKAINDSSSKVEAVLASSSGLLYKSKFPNGEKLTDDQFLFFWIDSIVGSIQYGSRISLCNSLKDKSADERFSILEKLAYANSASDYGTYFLKNETFAIQNGMGARAWMFQCCTQYGFWQTPSPQHTMRSRRIDISFYRRFCSQIFGANVWPDIDRKNMEYGGYNLKATNLLMVNGIEDPWRWASLQSSTGGIVSRIANCPDCAHCVQLYTPAADDSLALKKIRDEQVLNIQLWIQQYWMTLKKVSLRNA